MTDNAFENLGDYDYWFKKTQRGLDEIRSAWVDVLKNEENFASNVSEEDLAYELFDRPYRIKLLNLGDFGVMSIETNPSSKRDKPIELVVLKINQHGQLEKYARTFFDTSAYAYKFPELMHAALEADTLNLKQKYDGSYTTIE